MKQICLEGMSNTITDNWNLCDVHIDIYYQCFEK